MLTASTVDPAESGLSAEPRPPEPTFQAATLKLRNGRLRLKRQSSWWDWRAMIRSVTVFCVGIATALVWQSYSEGAREVIANSHSQLGWLAPPHRDTVPITTTVVAAAATVPSPDPQLIKLLSEVEELKQNLEIVQQYVDQIAAGQQQMASAIAKIQESDLDILHKVVSPPPPTPIAAARRAQAPTPTSQPSAR